MRTPARSRRSRPQVPRTARMLSGESVGVGVTRNRILWLAMLAGLVWLLSKLMYIYLLFGVRLPHPTSMSIGSHPGPDVVYTVSMVKGSVDEVPRWVDYHIRIGVTTMIIYDDNGPESPLPTLLRSRIATGDVELYSAPNYNVSTQNRKIFGVIPLNLFIFDKQQSVYIATWKRLWREGPWNAWLALLDLDEYINTKGKSLPSLLRQQREDFNVVNIHMMKLEYGVSGQRTPTPNLPSTYVFRDNETDGEAKHAGLALVRAITGMAGGCTHAFETNALLTNVALQRHECNDYRRVDQGQVIRGVWYAPPLIINVNHYVTRSLEECLANSRKVHIDGSTVQKPCYADNATIDPHDHPFGRFTVCDDSIQRGKCAEFGCTEGSNGFDGSCPLYKPLLNESNRAGR
eukprot:m.205134 g.205134  ORF g.205134 m.205134 type:complete len:403 (-) comp22812_c0_seq1:109-1317(-)